MSDPVMSNVRNLTWFDKTFKPYFPLVDVTVHNVANIKHKNTHTLFPIPFRNSALMRLCFSKAIAIRVPFRFNLAVQPNLRSHPALVPQRRVSFWRPLHRRAFMCNNTTSHTTPTTPLQVSSPPPTSHEARSLGSTDTKPFPLPPSLPPLYSIAPMMDVTDRHFRALARLISRQATLYTEMVVDRTVIHNPRLRDFELRLPPDPDQHPVVLQLGGSDALLMAQAATFASPHPFVEVNINCGCPSPKVADNGCFGAALMRTPQLVADIACAMAERLQVPVTVKCRLGLDDDTSYESLRNFVETVHARGKVTHFIIHARNAILGGLSPAQNRKIPPLRHDVVYQLVNDFPDLRFSINGGIKTVDDVLSHLSRGVFGVMVGRSVMDAPWRALRDVDSRIYQTPNVEIDGQPTTRRHILAAYKMYAIREVSETNCSMRAVVKPLLNLFHGERNGKLWRRTIDDGLKKRLTMDQLIDTAIAVVPDEVLDEPAGGYESEISDDVSEDSRENNVRSGEINASARVDRNCEGTVSTDKLEMCAPRPSAAVWTE